MGPLIVLYPDAVRNIEITLAWLVDRAVALSPAAFRMAPSGRKAIDGIATVNPPGLRPDLLLVRMAYGAWWRGLEVRGDEMVGGGEVQPVAVSDRRRSWSELGAAHAIATRPR
jgi:hypothetical protein